MFLFETHDFSLVFLFAAGPAVLCICVFVRDMSMGLWRADAQTVYGDHLGVNVSLLVGFRVFPRFLLLVSLFVLLSPFSCQGFHRF